MTTIAASAYPRNDVRCMFNAKSSSSSSSSSSSLSSESESKSKSVVAVAPVKETKPPAKKVEKKTEIDYLCDAYCKIIKPDKTADKTVDTTLDKDKVKELLRHIVDDLKIRPKKLYRYFHYIKYNSGKKTTPKLTLELLLQKPFEFITFQNQFISYKDAMNICLEENCTFPELRVRVVAWIYDYFIGKQNKYYIADGDDSFKLLTEFSNEFMKEKSKAEQLLFGGEIVIEIKFGQKIYYTTREFIDHEKRIGDMVLDLFHRDDDDDEDDEDGDVDYHEKIEQHVKAYIKKQNKDDFQFEPEQLEAIRKGCKLKRGELLNITGPPGTGKSTIVNCIVNFKMDRGSRIAIMAPTGLAQKNLKNSCKYDAVHDDAKNKKIMFSTLHRAINFTLVQKKGKDGKDGKDEEDPVFEPDMLVVDEASMIDLDLFFKLLKACKQFNTSLVLIGDVDQLPPIGPGIPFESIIQSGLFHTIKLKNIKRQDGNLKEVIEKLNTPGGIKPADFDGTSSVFIDAKTSEEIEKAVTKIYREEMARDANADIHTMCAQKEKGVFHLNPVIQNLKNGKSAELFVKKYENGHQHRFYEGDLVMRTENDYRDEHNVRVNGDVGTIHESRVKAKKYGRDVYEYRYTIKYMGGGGGNDEKTDEETNLSVEEVREAFVPFYASTVHKMQGLQKSIIVFIVSPDHSFCLTHENSKKLVYTAISRCKANFYVVGDKNLFVRSQQSKGGTNVYPTRFMKEFNKYDIEV